MKTYIVKETHLGDKPEPYKVGETRVAAANEVQHLVEAGILAEPEPEPEPQADKSPTKSPAKAN